MAKAASEGEEDGWDEKQGGQRKGGRKKNPKAFLRSFFISLFFFVVFVKKKNLSPQSRSLSVSSISLPTSDFFKYKTHISYLVENRRLVLGCLLVVWEGKRGREGARESRNFSFFEPFRRFFLHKIFRSL